jgi:hypothetical protein
MVDPHPMRGIVLSTLTEARGRMLHEELVRRFVHLAGEAIDELMGDGTVTREELTAGRIVYRSTVLAEEGV